MCLLLSKPIKPIESFATNALLLNLFYHLSQKIGLSDVVLKNQTIFFIASAAIQVGRHYLDENKEYRNTKSKVFLENVVPLLLQAGAISLCKINKINFMSAIILGGLQVATNEFINYWYSNNPDGSGPVGTQRAQPLYQAPLADADAPPQAPKGFFSGHGYRLGS